MRISSHARGRLWERFKVLKPAEFVAEAQKHWEEVEDPYRTKQKKEPWFRDAQLFRYRPNLRECCYFLVKDDTITTVLTQEQWRNTMKKIRKGDWKDNHVGGVSGGMWREVERQRRLTNGSFDQILEV